MAQHERGGVGRRPMARAGGAIVLTLILAACGAPGPSGGDLLSSSPADFQEIIENAKEKVFPALVFIQPIVEDFEQGEKIKQQVFGSGVIISPDGLVVTNNHVVEKAVKVLCVLSDKDQVGAKILGRDPDTDLALLRLEVPADRLPLPYGEFGDSSALVEGDFVMAMGSPFGFRRSVSLGIVSNTQRYLGFGSQYKYNTWIQTDAAINPGNSGGPLINIRGEIVGINTLGMNFGESIGFSIPSNVARDIVERLRVDGVARRASVGLKLQPLKDFFTNTFTAAERGVLIADVETGSAAEAAGLMRGDILLDVADQPVDGTYVESLPAIHRRLADLPTDAPTSLTILRAGAPLTVAVTPDPKGKVEGDDFECRRWNMTVKEINRHRDPALFYYMPEGIYVQGVRWPGAAADADVSQGDILLSIDGRPARSLKELEVIYREALADEKREKKLLLELQRGRFRKWVVLDYTKDYDKEN